MDDITKPIPPLPDDPAALKRIIRQRDRKIMELAREQDSRIAELTQERDARIVELEKACDELTRERDRQVAELTKERDQKIAELELERLRLAHQLELLKKRYYGPRADRVDLGQLLLEFAQELEARPVNPQDLPAGTPAQEAEAKTIRRVKRGRRNLAQWDKLPTVEKVHDLTEAQKIGMTKIGQEITWQIERAPGFFYRIRHVQLKYARPELEAAGENPQITLAEKPLQPIEKGMAGPGLLAYVATSKFADYLPLYRLENIFSRAGFTIDRSTMCVWMGDVADLVKPVYDRMVQRVLESHVIGTDDTVMPMLAPEKCQQARMWIYRGDDAHPHNVFDFTLSRKRDGPATFLGEFKGTLLADAYGGYDGIAIEKDITLAGCWAHGRRKFVDSHDLCPEIAGGILLRIRRLFAIEEPIKGRPPDERLAVRREKSVPVLAELHGLLLSGKEKLLPKHPVAGAIGYVLNQWKPLNTFASDGAVDIDNNFSEQEMKRQALNRKNSLFVGNQRGGRTAAILSSITSTCRRHGVDPQFYFTQLLTNLPGTPMSEVDDWLPDAFKRRGLDPAVAYAQALSLLRR